MNYASHNTNTFSLRGIVMPTLCGAAQRREGPEEVASEQTVDQSKSRCYKTARKGPLNSTVPIE